MAIQSLSTESVDVVTKRATHLLAGLEDRLQALGELYRDLHRHPELSMQEHRTCFALKPKQYSWIGLHHLHTMLPC
jgi:hippurate hydrolase